MQYRRTTFGTNVSNEKSKQKQSIAWTVKVWTLFQDLFKNYSWNNILRSIGLCHLKVDEKSLLISYLSPLSKVEGNWASLKAADSWMLCLNGFDQLYGGLFYKHRAVTRIHFNIFWKNAVVRCPFVAYSKRSDTSHGIDHSGWEWNNFSPILAISSPAT